MSSHVGVVQWSNWNSVCAIVQIGASIDEQVEDAYMHGEKKQESCCKTNKINQIVDGTVDGENSDRNSHDASLTAT